MEWNPPGSPIFYKYAQLSTPVLALLRRHKIMCFFFFVCLTFRIFGLFVRRVWHFVKDHPIFELFVRQTRTEEKENIGLASRAHPAKK